MKELSLEIVQSQMSKKQQLLINEETVNEINKLAADPDYGPEFVESYMDHLNVFKDMPRATHAQYVNALKFFSMVEAGNSLTDAYIKVFPERFEERTKGSGDKSVMRHEACRYNNSKMVNEIRKVAAIPVQLIHRHLLHEAILNQADLMRSARSEMVRQRAGATLIAELKPLEDTVITVDVEDGAKSVIEELRQATERLAAQERQAVQAGTPLKQVAESDIYEAEFTEESNESS